MGAADTEIFSRDAADPAPGFWENVDGRVNFPHLGCVGGVSRNAELVVQGPQAPRRAVQTILVELIQPESDLAHGVEGWPIFSLAGRGHQVQAEEEG